MSKPKPIYSFETLPRTCYDLKVDGKRICITHGAFDLFHTSHLDLLKQSAAISDYLIVGIESDEHVASYKDSKRPVVDENSRAQIIRELNCVDAVFINNFSLDSQTYTDIYKELYVDFVTIGYKFQFEEVMEDQVRRAGSKLIRLRTKQIPTTTSLIEKIVEEYH